ncbi:MAG: hypothetical protein JSV90_03940 [Methanobacteriota archaeon]|nr:MAG: hypothetical protein JSV90_03940 [Euryarchaeota archaeon]
MPVGSDTYLALDLSKSLIENERAKWILDARSYIGLFPASYPSGTVFLNSELQALSGISWNSIPWLVSPFFSVLLLLSGFILLRSFGIRDDYAVVFSGILSLAPMFLYFTHGQVSPRAFIMPIILLALSQLFMVNCSPRSRFAMFVVFAFCAMTIHRSSYVLPILALVWVVATYIIPSPTPFNKASRKAAYIALLLVATVFILGPFLPVVGVVFEDVSEISVSYRLAEMEFNTGFLFSGDSPLALLGNLAANYVGSIGLITLMLPFGLVVLFARSSVDSGKKYYLFAVFFLFSPLVWNAQYSQLILMPFICITGAMAVQKRHEWITLFRNSLPARRIFKLAPGALPKPRGRAVFVFVVCCVLFSVFMFDHRMGVSEAFTEEGNQPSDSTVNLGIYLGASISFEERAFVANSGLLERRVRWISGWDAPVNDVTVLLANGYLELEGDDFIFDPGSDVSRISYLSSFYKPDKFYRLDTLSDDFRIASLSWGDIYGFLRLYFIDSGYAIGPEVSASEAGISVVIEIALLGDSLGSRFTYGVLPSMFLKEVSSETYLLYEDGEFLTYLAAIPTWS